MASVIKPKGRTKYTVKFKDQHKKKRTTAGFRDKKLSLELGRKLESDAARLRAGEPLQWPDVTAEILGIATPRKTARVWAEVSAEYLADLVRRGSPKGGSHYDDVEEQLAKVARDCGWQTLADVTADSFAAFLDGLRNTGRAPRTLNKYHQCADAFLDWCRSPPRCWLGTNPLDGMARAKGGRQARRRLRRAYAPDELARLLAAAPDRRRIVYEVAAYSGLRREELRRLQKCDCDPTGPRPRWHLRPEVSKNGLAWNLPMLPECAAVLRPLWEALPSPGSLVFGAGRGDEKGQRGRPRNDTGPGVPKITSLYEDLQRAGVDRVDVRGRHADFHSFRYTFCKTVGTALPIQKVKLLMRHLTLGMTADLYADLEMEDVAEEVWDLPPLFRGSAAPLRESRGGAGGSAA
jgi:integrase